MEKLIEKIIIKSMLLLFSGVWIPPIAIYGCFRDGKWFQGIFWIIFGPLLLLAVVSCWREYNKTGNVR